MEFNIHLQKENFKFSCSHFTILSATHGERLHGHNYYVAVNLGLREISKDLGMAIDFNAIKPVVRELCDRLDERILLPENSPYLQIKKSSSEVEVIFAGKRYVFPKDDCYFIPVSNITSEELARFFVNELHLNLANGPFVSLEVSIQETNGQSVAARKKI